jgi:hypothetical protein
MYTSPLHPHLKHGGLAHKDSEEAAKESDRRIPFLLLAYTASNREATGTTTASELFGGGTTVF